VQVPLTASEVEAIFKRYRGTGSIELLCRTCEQFRAELEQLKQQPTAEPSSKEGQS
jgi:hypothetical protein